MSMRVGVAIEETWDFLNEIYADLSIHYQTSLFSPRTIKSPVLHERINRRLFRRDLQAFMRSNDVVFFEWASRLLTAAAQLPKACGIVTRLHRYEMYQWVDKINWDTVDKIILVSRAKQREFVERFPAQAEKTTVIYEAVDIKRFQFEPKSFTGNIGILCHLSPRKRVYELILTFHELLKRDSNLRLHIAGGRHWASGDYYVALHHIVKALELTDKVIFYDNVQDTWNWYKEIDIFISNSYSEGLQVAPMEAMAIGCYCLSHWWDGADELVPEENLFFTDRDLVKKILDYCALTEAEKQDRRQQMRQMTCETFNVDKTKVQIRQVIEDVATSR